MEELVPPYGTSILYSACFLQGRTISLVETLASCNVIARKPGTYVHKALVEAIQSAGQKAAIPVESKAETGDTIFSGRTSIANRLCFCFW
jgi:hypothetical protein